MKKEPAAAAAGQKTGGRGRNDKNVGLEHQHPKAPIDPKTGKPRRGRPPGQPQKSIDWVLARQYYELNPRVSLKMVADRFGISYESVKKTHYKQQWARTIELSIGKAVAVKLAGVTGCALDGDAYAAAVEKEAAIRAQIVWKHRNRWGELGLAMDALQSDLDAIRQDLAEVHQMSNEDRAALEFSDPRFRAPVRLVELQSELNAYQRLSDVLTRQTAGERKAWNLDVDISDMDTWERQKVAYALAEQRFREEAERVDKRLGDRPPPPAIGGDGEAVH